MGSQEPARERRRRVSDLQEASGFGHPSGTDPGQIRSTDPEHRSGRAGTLIPMSIPLLLHGHFYQPPRENPWTEIIDPEPTAAPYPDWNERIHAECYRANAFARIFDAHQRVEAIRNDYR